MGRKRLESLPSSRANSRKHWKIFVLKCGHEQRWTHASWVRPRDSRTRAALRKKLARLADLRVEPRSELGFAIGPLHTEPEAKVEVEGTSRRLAAFGEIPLHPPALRDTRPSCRVVSSRGVAPSSANTLGTILVSPRRNVRSRFRRLRASAPRLGWE